MGTAFVIGGKMKERIHLTDKEIKGITSKKLGDTVEFTVSGRISSLSEGYDKEEKTACVEIESINGKKVKEDSEEYKESEKEEE